MTDLQQALIELLADGATHAATTLAAALDIAPGEVAAQVEALADLDLEVHSAAADYRLARPLELLEARKLAVALQESEPHGIETLEVHASSESTNSYLLAQHPPPPGRARVCLAEYQRGGRGRRGRSWCSAYGAGLCLSLAWEFARAPRQLACLSLAVGVAVRRLLARHGVAPELKWPNDLLVDGRKLGGVLIEARDAGSDATGVVIGVGLNLDLPKSTTLAIRSAAGGERALEPVALYAVAPALRGERNTLAAGLVTELIGALRTFEASGFAQFAAAWREADCLNSKEVMVGTGSQVFTGRACGIDADGALLVAAGGRRRRFMAGEVSLREVRDD